MRTKNLYNLLVQRLRTDLDRILGKNLLADRLIKPVWKFAKSVTKTNSKVLELKTYDKAIKYPVYKNK